jgi:predicted kinase
MQTPNYAEILPKRKFDHTTAVVQDKIYFTIDNGIDEPAVIGTAGNFIALTGLPKAGKSTFVSALISSFITGKPHFTFNLKSYQDKYKIAVFDTEQSPFDFNRTIYRIERFTNYDRAGIFKFFDAYLTREDNSSDILRLINEYLKQTPECAILIIDGILDLIDNMNDEGASKRLIRVLKKLGKKYDILIITVLHLGKKDNSSIGHIGSASDRYAQSTLLIEKTKEGTFTCVPKFLRSAKDFETIEIKYSEEKKIFVQIKP